MDCFYVSMESIQSCWWCFLVEVFLPKYILVLLGGDPCFPLCLFGMIKIPAKISV